MTEKLLILAILVILSSVVFAQAMKPLAYFQCDDKGMCQVSETDVDRIQAVLTTLQNMIIELREKKDCQGA